MLVRSKLRPDGYPADLPFASLLKVVLDKKYTSESTRAAARRALVGYCLDLERPEGSHPFGII
jgi:hypothetical protein